MVQSKPKYFIQTLGCKANWLDSQVIETSFRQEGWEAAADAESADYVVVNTCTVTDEADRQSQREAVLARKKNPHAKVVMTGCGAEVAPDEILRKTGARFVIGNQDKHRFAQLLQTAEKSGQVGALGGVETYGELLSQHPMDRTYPTPESSFMIPVDAQALSTGRTRAFLKIQEGCDSFCTYCIIPYGRGPSRSLGIPEIVDQVKRLVDEGMREIVLTGTNIGEYGENSGDSEPRYRTEAFDRLVAEILHKTSLERLRLSSLDPAEISDTLLGMLEPGGRLCPHFHVSLQSPQTKVLRLMKRKYRAEAVVETLTKLGARPESVFVGMDVITGFPGEGEAEFEETVALLRDLYWTRLHVFPYSERSGTPATRMKEKVPPAVRKERARVLRELSLERLRGAYTRHQGETHTGVLLESTTRGPDRSRVWVGGYSPNYLRCLVPFDTLEAAEAQFGQVVAVKSESSVLDARSGDVAYLGMLTKTVNIR